MVAAALVASLAVDLVVLRTRLILRRAFWVAYAIVLGFQLLMNGVLTGLPVVRYDPDAILGPRVARAPIEDIGFGFAMVLLTLAAWVRLGRVERRPGQPRRAASSRDTASARRPRPTETRRSSTR